MVSDSNGQVHVVKNMNIMIALPQKIHIGCICFHKLYVLHCVCLALFDCTKKDNLILTNDELVENRGSFMYIHILSAAQMKSIFTFDEKFISKSYCFQKSINCISCKRSVFTQSSWTKII